MKKTTYEVHYDYKGKDGGRSGNPNAFGTFNSLTEALDVASKEEAKMGPNYRYRAVPVVSKPVVSVKEQKLEAEVAVLKTKLSKTEHKLQSIAEILAEGV